MSSLAELETRPTELRIPSNVLGVVAVLVLLAVFVLMGRLLQGPSFVSQVVLVNPTHYDFNVALTNGRPDDVILLGVAQPMQTTTVNEVIDQGNTWDFTMSRAGVTTGVLRVSRSTLQAHHWQVVIPASFATTLDVHGQPPPS